MEGKGDPFFEGSSGLCFWMARGHAWLTAELSPAGAGVEGCVTGRLKGLHSKPEGLWQTLEFVLNHKKTFSPQAYIGNIAKTCFTPSLMYCTDFTIKRWIAKWLWEHSLSWVSQCFAQWMICLELVSAQSEVSIWFDLWIWPRLSVVRCANQFLNAFFLSMHLWSCLCIVDFSPCPSLL